MSLIGIGLTGLQAHQTALATTGNNVTNANTPGYSRQVVSFGTNQEQFTGAGYVGAGVSITDIKRIVDEFATGQLRADTTLFNQQEVLAAQLKQLDDLLGSDSTGLTPALNNFFSALQSAADDPTAIPERQLLLSQAQGLVSRFQSIDSRMLDLRRGVDAQLSSITEQVNTLAASIAQLNTKITNAPGASQGVMPNALLDARDQKLKELSALVQVSAVPNGSSINVLIGNGQPLVIGQDASKLQLVQSPSDPTRQEVAIATPGKAATIVSRDLSGGQIGALLEFREQTLEPAINALGMVALAITDSVNKVHQLGMDLEGQPGGAFFRDINDPAIMAQRVIPNLNNALPNDRRLSVEITDVNQLTSQSFTLQLSGPNNNNFVLRDSVSGQIIKQGIFSALLPASIELPGFELSLQGGSFQVGDSFLIQPTFNGARDIKLELSRVEQIALAQPIRGKSDLTNTGNGVLSQGEMLATINPLTNQPLSAFAVPGALTPPLLVRFLSDTTYEVLDNTDPSNPKALQPPLNNQTYQPGVTNNLFTTDPGATLVTTLGTALTTLGVGTATNGYLAQTMTVNQRDPLTGLVTSTPVVTANDDSAESIAAQLNAIPGAKANAYTQVKLSNFVDAGPTIATLTINGENFNLAPPVSSFPPVLADAINNNGVLKAAGIFAVTDGTSVTLHATSGKDITVDVVGDAGDGFTLDKVNPYTGGVAATQAMAVGGVTTTTVGGVLDINLANGVSVTANNNNLITSVPVAQSSYRGFQFDLTGNPDADDLFTIEFNAGGTSDNRNALALATLSAANLLSNGRSTFNESYGEVVENVGVRTSRANQDKESSQILLTQSEARQQAISGVSLDEEAGKLIQFQAAYNASAQVISIARDLFDTLINTFR